MHSVSWHCPLADVFFNIISSHLLCFPVARPHVLPSTWSYNPSTTDLASALTRHWYPRLCDEIHDHDRIIGYDESQ
jgi:hypothetical protein